MVKMFGFQKQQAKAPPVGEESWLVSPVLDFSNANKASMFYDLSYVLNGDQQLKILYSEDCGQTYNNMLNINYNSTFNSGTYWTPFADSSWSLPKRSISINALTGKDQLRFAFVATANNGNNLYIDNIEFFIDDDLSPLTISNAYSVYGGGDEMKLTFSLTEKQTVFLKIYDIQGRVLVDNTLSDVLNQTYSFDLGIQGSGIYIVRVALKDQVSATKVFLNGK